ncbi:unnamed protein product [Lactuca virosa]|uniref:Uncharacterized protein n=1 Tax=Lactuca virosa TaxID=75947 RepID=A0AAU9NHF3_9ASTR|nr:unnamed protein product [Lactuca virosa]
MDSSSPTTQQFRFTFNSKSEIGTSKIEGGNWNSDSPSEVSSSIHDANCNGTRVHGYIRFQLKVSVQFQVFETNQPKKPRERTRKKASKTVLVPSTFIMQWLVI